MLIILMLFAGREKQCDVRKGGLMIRRFDFDWELSVSQVYMKEKMKG